MITFQLDGKSFQCAPGLTVAGALYKIGNPVLRVTEMAQEPRSIFCGMGVCFECSMTIDGQPSVRACVTPLTEGMQLSTQRGFPGVNTDS